MKKNKDIPKTRLLPGDFQKYLSLDDTRKEANSQTARGGFFRFPNDYQGVQDIGIKNFLVFYFDKKEDYEVVKKFFEISGKGKSHPALDEKKLTDLVRRLHE